MAEPSKVDPARRQMWDRICREAREVVAAEPALASYVYATVLAHETLQAVVVQRVAAALDHAEVPAELLRVTYEQALAGDPGIVDAFNADLAAVDERDPAAGKLINTLLYFKGFAALQAHRLAHWLWRNSRRDLASYIQSRSSAAFGVDIHPAARLGKGVMIDHGTGVVIGETAVVDDDVSILQGVTLGGTGKETGDRHPKIRRGVMIGAGATVLGNIEIGAGARVAAGSVVLRAVPAGKTVAGIPSKIVGDADEPAHTMDQNFDPVI